MILPYVHYSAYLGVELQQARQEGRDLAALEGAAARINALSDPYEKERQAAKFFDEVQSLPCTRAEPDVMPDVSALVPGDAPQAPDRMLGGIHGASAGALLGVAFETWPHTTIAALLRGIGAFPPRKPIALDQLPQTIRARFGIGEPAAATARAGTAPACIATDGMMLALLVAEAGSCDAMPESLAEQLVRYAPLLTMPPAYRVAARNLLLGVSAGSAARLRNPFREFSAAQAFSGMFGLLYAGDAASAVRAAWTAASLAHVKNGLYAPAYLAALSALADERTATAELVTAAKAVVPPQSRLAEAIDEAIALQAQHRDPLEAMQRLHAQWSDKEFYGANHAVPNAAIVTLALLYGGYDLERTLGLALLAGHHTTINCAAVGGIVGAALGAARLPEAWIDPVRDGMRTRLAEHAFAPAEQLVHRMEAVIDAREPA